MTTTQPSMLLFFSFHEQGYYDLAASIDYALNTTGQRNLYLIGHSRGTTSSFVLLSTRPAYNEKVRLLINYAPVAYIKHAKGALLQAFLKNTSMRQAKVTTIVLTEDGAN